MIVPCGLIGQRQLRLGHRPSRIFANSHLVAMTDGAAGSRLEKEFRPLRRVDTIVKVAASGILRLFHARAAAAVVGHSRRPHFLAVNGRQQFRSMEFHGRRFPLHHRFEAGLQVVVRQQGVPGQCADTVLMAVFLNKPPRSCPKEPHWSSCLPQFPLILNARSDH